MRYCGKLEDKTGYHQLLPGRISPAVLVGEAGLHPGPSHVVVVLISPCISSRAVLGGHAVCYVLVLVLECV
jgi:hypothetical protein